LEGWGAKTGGFHYRGWRGRLYCSVCDLTGKMADLQPKTLAIMHGSSFTGDCVRALDDLNMAFREVFGRERQAQAGSV